MMGGQGLASRFFLTKFSNKKCAYFAVFGGLVQVVLLSKPWDISLNYQLSWALCLRVLLAITTAVLSAIGMEYYARYAHGTLWHGPGDSRWAKIHRSHHSHKSEADLFELNDLYSLVNIPFVVATMAWAVHASPSFPRACLLGYTIGVSVFGCSYMAVHDGVHHGRFPVGPLKRVQCIRRVADAHAEHHKGGGVPFGMFLGPEELAAKAEGRPPAPAPRWLIGGLKATGAFTVLGLAAELGVALLA